VRPLDRGERFDALSELVPAVVRDDNDIDRRHEPRVTAVWRKPPDGFARFPDLPRKILLFVALGVAAGLLAAGSAPTGATVSARGGANLWVDANGGACARSGKAQRYVDARACGSLSAAYGAARPGDRVLVMAGRYGRQVLPAGKKKLTIRNAPGARPVLGTTSVEASNITLAGVTVRRDDDPGSSVATLDVKGGNNTFDRVHVNTRNMQGRQGIGAHGDRNTFKNGSTFNVVDEKGALVGGSHVAFVNFDFHDVRVTGSEVHNECVYSNGPNLTVRRSHFWKCPTMDLFITRGTWWNQPAYGGVTIENNVFEHSTMEGADSWHYYGLLFGGQLSEGGAPIRDLKVRYNTFEQSVSLVDSFRATGNSEWVGNVGGGWDCIPGMKFRHNVGEKCSASDKKVARPSSCGPPACRTVVTATQGWVDPAKHDFRLKAGAPAINAGDPSDFPRIDKAGKARPARGKPDAGAYEHRPR
jgi:hypothetical protein